MANLNKPTRMCVCCRVRDEQKNLLRIQCKDKKLQTFDGFGRSFYICSDCLENNDKKLEKTLFRECKNKDGYLTQLKEMLIYVR